MAKSIRKPPKPQPTKKSKHKVAFTARISCIYYTSTYQKIHNVPSCILFLILVKSNDFSYISKPYSEIQLDLTFHLSDKEECKCFFDSNFSDYARFCSCILCRTDLSLALMWTIYYLISQNVTQFNLFHRMKEWCFCGFCWMNSTSIQKPSDNSSKTRTTAYCISISRFISAG